MFIKSFAAIAAVSALGAGSAMAGPYVNVESNSGFVGSDYSDTGSYYIQAGPAIVSADGEDRETEFSGKVGVGVDVAENVNVYGEIAFLTDGSEDASYGTKLGVKYNFWFNQWLQALLTEGLFLFSIMNDPVWSVNLLVIIDVLAVAGVVWWAVNYDKLYNK